MNIGLSSFFKESANKWLLAGAPPRSFLVPIKRPQLLHSDVRPLLAGPGGYGGESCFQGSDPEVAVRACVVTLSIANVGLSGKLYT